MSKKIEYLDYRKHGLPYIDSNGQQYGDCQKPTSSPLFETIRRNKILYYKGNVKGPMHISSNKTHI